MAGDGSSCGACKFLRRKCTSECVFTPFFCDREGADHFAAVHKVFGANNVSKLLMKLPLQHRSEAAITISYEASARMHDPIYGCVAQILALQQQVASLQEEIDELWNYLAYASLGLPTYPRFQEINSPNSGLPFSNFQCSDMSIRDDLRLQRPPLLPAPEQGSSLSLEGPISTSYSFAEHPHPLLQNDIS